MAGFKCCPHCQTEQPQRVRFTPWGGWLGPLLLSLVKCAACGSHFNGKNGRCVKNAIKLYTLTTLLVLVAIMALLMYQVAGGAKKNDRVRTLQGGTAQGAPVVPTSIA